MQSEAPFDQVVDQDPNPREEAEEGSTVVLEVSGGPGTVRVPTVRGCRSRWRSRRSSKRDLRATVDRRPSETIEKGIAIRTVPARRRGGRPRRARAAVRQLRARAGRGARRDRACRATPRRICSPTRASSRDRGARVRGARGRGDLRRTPPAGTEVDRGDDRDDHGLDGDRGGQRAERGRPEPPATPRASCAPPAWCRCAARPT